MNTGSAPWRPRIVGCGVAPGPARDWTGRVVSAREGLVLVARGGQRLRASIGGGLLARMAAEPGEAPKPGDRVRLRTWADGRVTVERVLTRASHEPEG